MTSSQLQDALTRGFAELTPSSVGTTIPSVVGIWIGGIVVVVTGGLGVAVAVFYRRSLYKAMAGAMAGLGFGIALLVVGLSAPLLQWPFSAFYPLVLGGVVVSTLFLGLAWSLRRYWRHEGLRRIAAMDLS